MRTIGLGVLARQVGIAAAMVLLALSGCRSGSGETTLQSIEVTPTNTSVPAGAPVAMAATAIFSDNTHTDVTSQTEWTSSDPAIAAIDAASGAVQTLKAGSVTITAVHQGKTGSTNLTVNNATLKSIAITPPAAGLASGTTLQFVATGTYSDDSTLNLTSAATWASSDTTRATISNAADTNGLVTALAAGGTNITASVNDITSNAVALTVTAAELVAIAIDPTFPVVALGTTQQLTATGIFSDNSRQDLTSQVTWTSSAPGKATVDTTGLATSVAVGSSNISASLTPTGGTAVTSPAISFTVTSAALVSIAVTPTATTIVAGLKQQFTATGTYTDNTTHDLTSAATWASSDTAIATVSNANGSNGLATSVRDGRADLTATFGGVASMPVALTVSPADIASISVTPANPIIALGTTQQFTATAILTDGTAFDATSSATWATSDAAIAAVASGTPTPGLGTALAVGNANITASIARPDGGTTTTSPPVLFTVTPARLVSISVTPATPSIAAGTSQRFVATGTFSNGATQDLSSSVTWLSSDVTKATISNTAASNGVATGVAAGSSDISASLTHSGTTVTSPTVPLTVTAATLVSIAVSPTSASMPLGLTQQFTATGQFSDGTTQNITGLVTWASSAPARATISNVAGSTGLATAFAVGVSNITAASGAITSPTVPLTVTAATLTSLAITPANPGKGLIGTLQQFTATGTYSDATTLNLTSAVTWTSSDVTKASISNAAGSNGLATPLAAGSANIGATLRGVTATAVPYALVAVSSIAVTPANPTVNIGSTLQFTATANLSDATTQNITSLATWASSNTARATISNASGTKGVATSVSFGNTDVTATLGSVSSPAVTMVNAATYTTPGAASFTVPAGVTSLRVAAMGGGGGGGTNGGGAGALVTATLTVVPGNTLNLFVGGGGSRYCCGTGAAGGGGSTNVNLNDTVINNPLIIAGGGGGGGYARGGGSGSAVGAGPGNGGSGGVGNQGGGGVGPAGGGDGAGTIFSSNPWGGIGGGGGGFGGGSPGVAGGSKGPSGATFAAGTNGGGGYAGGGNGSVVFSLP